MENGKSRLARLREPWRSLHWQYSSEGAFKSFLWQAALIVNEEIVVFIFQLKNSVPFRICTLFCLATAGFFSAFSIHKMAELSGAIIFSLLGAVVVAITFLATILQEHSSERKAHYEKIMDAVRQNKSYINRNIEAYKEDPRAKNEYAFSEIIRLHILANVQKGDDLVKLRGVMSGFSPTNQWLSDKFANIHELVKGTYTDYVWVCRAALKFLRESVNDQQLVEQLRILEETVSAPLPGSMGTLFYFREMLGRRVFRVMAYSFVVLILTSVVASTDSATIWPLMPVRAYSVPILKWALLATLLGVILLVFRYLLLLTKFIRDSAMRDDVPYVDVYAPNDPDLPRG